MRPARNSGGKKKGVTTFLRDIKRLFLDTAPLIYYAEKHPQYQKILKPIFSRIDKGYLMNPFWIYSNGTSNHRKSGHQFTV